MDIDNDLHSPVGDDVTIGQNDVRTPQPMNSDRCKNELRMTVAKPCPRSYESHILWEIAKRVIDGQDVSRDLNNCVRRNFFRDHPSQRRRPDRPANESNRKKRRRMYAQTQEKFRKQQSRCAKEILDGEPTHKVEDEIDFLRQWKKVMEGPVLSESLDPVVRPRHESFDPFGPITSGDVKRSLPPLGSAPGPDGFTSWDLHKVPAPVLTVLLNALNLQKRLPVCLRSARTIFLPKLKDAAVHTHFRRDCTTRFWPQGS